MLHAKLDVRFIGADMNETPGARIREATPGDIAAILAFDAQGRDPDRLRRVNVAVRERHCWVASVDDEVTGYLVADASFYGYPFAWLLAVAPEFRRRGIGTALMKHFESAFKASKVFTSTNKSNLASQRLMESLGFQRSGWIENLDEGDPEIVYVKRRHAD